MGDVENSIDINGYSEQEKRVFGYLSEMLMDVWINENGVHYVEQPWGQLGHKHLVRKIISFLLRKLRFNHISTHF